MVKLYMFQASLAHHQEFRNCVCSQVSYSISLDSVFCLLHAVSVQGFVGPGLVCDGCPLGGVRCELWHHSLFTLSAHHQEDNHRTPIQDPRNLAQIQHMTNKRQNQEQLNMTPGCKHSS